MTGVVVTGVVVTGVGTRRAGVVGTGVGTRVAGAVGTGVGARLWASARLTANTPSVVTMTRRATRLEMFLMTHSLFLGLPFTP